MKLLKIFTVILAFLTIVNLSYAVLDDAESWISFDAGDVTGTTLEDVSGNNIDFTCTNMASGCNTVPGLLRNASDLDGSNDYATRTSWFNAGDDRTYNIWGKSAITNYGTWPGLLGDLESTGGMLIRIDRDTDTPGVIFNLGASNYQFIQDSTAIDTDWHMYTATYNGSQFTFWTDGVWIGSYNATIGPTANANFQIGRDPDQVADRVWNGDLDEAAVYTRALTPDEISELYNSGMATNPYVTAPAINSNITTYYNSLSLNVSLNTSSPSNYSYILNGGGLISIENDTTSTSVILTGIEGLNNVSWFSENVNGTAWTNETFTIDVTNPVLINNIPSELNVPDRTINLNSSIIRNDSLSGIASCVVDFNNTQSTNCTNTSFQFLTAGNFTYNITVLDNAGNINSTSSLILVNPNQTLRFNNTFTGSFISGYELQFDSGYNFTATGTNASIPLFDLPLGVNDFTFVKFGFNQTNFSITTNLTSQIDQIFQVNAITLVMTMFNASNPSEQLIFNATIGNSTDSVFFINQLNFEQDFNSLPSGDITILVDSPDFKQAKFFQTITPFTAINITGLLIPDSIGETVTFEVRQFGSDILIAGVLIEAQQLVNGSFMTVSQATTDESGSTFMSLDPDEEYKFILTREGFVTGTTFAIPGTTSYTIRLRTITTQFGFIDGISYRLLPTNSLLNTNENHTFEGFLSGTGLTIMNYTLVTDNGTVLFNQNSTNPTGTTFTTTLEILNTTSIATILATLTYVKDGQQNSITELYTLQNVTNSSIINIAKNFNTDDSEDAQLGRWLLMVLSIAGAILAGRIIGVNTTGAGLLIIPVVYFWNSLGWMPLNYAFAIAFAAGVFFVGGRIIR